MRTAVRVIALMLNTLMLVYMVWSLYLISHILSWSLISDERTWFNLIPVVIGILAPLSSFFAILASRKPRPN